jgi:hypothetical protein
MISSTPTVRMRSLTNHGRAISSYWKIKKTAAEE